MCGEVFIYIFFLWNARFVAVGTYVFSRPTDFGRAPICDEFQLHSGGLHFSLRQLSHTRRALPLQIVGFLDKKLGKKPVRNEIEKISAEQ
jgi:hypothetical protein